MAYSKNQVGVFAFAAALFVALFIAVVQPVMSPTTEIMALGLIGLAVGLLNITDNEMPLYMLASAALIFCASAFSQVLGTLPYISGFLERLLVNLLYIIIPGVMLVALRVIYDSSKSYESIATPLQSAEARRLAEARAYAQKQPAPKMVMKPKAKRRVKPTPKKTTKRSRAKRSRTTRRK